MTTTFDTATWSFLDDLARDNTKAFFDGRRDVYRDHVTRPSAAFVTQMADLLPERVHPGLQGEAKVGRSLFRFNRDTRFSHDKTPYKTHLDFLFWIGEGPPREQPACIARITSTTVLLGAGQMGLRGAALARYRARLDDPDDGSRIRSAVDQLEADGAVLSDPDRAKPPRPFAREHPNAGLLRRDGFHVTRTDALPATSTTPSFADWCADRLAPFRPVLEWLTDPEA